MTNNSKLKSLEVPVYGMPGELLHRIDLCLECICRSES